MVKLADGAWTRRRQRFQAMASPCEILLWSTDAEAADAAIAAAIAEVRRIEQKYSRYRPDSMLSAINAAAGASPVPIDVETAQLLAYADELWRLSDGAFDATSGVLREVWDFRSGRLPEPSAVEAVRRRIGWPRVELALGTVRLGAAGMQLDFGGFGKEYACDRAAGILSARGIEHAMINLGGDVRALAAQADGRPWRVAIQHPRAPDLALATIDLHAGGLATSGDYQRYMDIDGRRYSHVLDPRSGWPVQPCARSVSVLAPLCLVAGSAATCALLAGADGWQSLAGREWLWVDATGEIRMSGAQFELRACPAEV